MPELKKKKISEMYILKSEIVRNSASSNISTVLERISNRILKTRARGK